MPMRERLAHARVLVVGLEPWGAVAAIELAAAGVGALHLLDDGQVNDDDLVAVRLFTEADRGGERTSALATALSAKAPGCKVSSGPLSAAPHRALVLDDTRWDLVLAGVP